MGISGSIGMRFGDICVVNQPDRHAMRVGYSRAAPFVAEQRIAGIDPTCTRCYLRLHLIDQQDRLLSC